MVISSLALPSLPNGPSLGSLFVGLGSLTLAAAAETFPSGKLIVGPPSLPTGPSLGSLFVGLGSLTLAAAAETFPNGKLIVGPPSLPTGPVALSRNRQPFMRSSA
jgi:hypothetical protein